MAAAQDDVVRGYGFPGRQPHARWNHRWRWPGTKTGSQRRSSVSSTRANHRRRQRATVHIGSLRPAGPAYCRFDRRASELRFVPQRCRSSAAASSAWKCASRPVALLGCPRRHAVETLDGLMPGGPTRPRASRSQEKQNLSCCFPEARDNETKTKSRSGAMPDAAAAALQARAASTEQSSSERP